MTPTPKSGLIRKLPILLIAAVAMIGAFTLRDQLGFDALARHRDTLLAYRDAHYALSVVGFVAAYVAIVAFSLPGGLIATLTGGFLFGMFPGVFLNVIGATVGAVAVFVAARAGFGAAIAERMARSGGAVGRLQTGLQENAWSVLFMMRLVPAVPFFLANLLPAFVGVRLWPFAVTTFLGILPATTVFTSIGSGLGDVFAAGGRPDLSVFFSAPVMGPILGLAALSALPMILKRFRKGA